MNDEMIDFNNLLAIRNHLGIVSESQLITMYKDPSSFLSFIDSVDILIENDSGFLLLDSSFIEKIFSVFQFYRFDCDDDLKNDINDLIVSLNRIRNYPESLSTAMKDGYFSYQESKRRASFQSTESLIASLSYDALVFSGLLNGRLDRIKDGDYYLMSLHYLMSVYPEFFQEKEVFNRSLKMIDSICSNCRNFSKRKKYVKEARERILQLKGE